MTDYLDASGVRDIAKSMSDAVIACRTRRHPWEPENCIENTVYGYYTVSEVCPRCGTRKVQELNRNWAVLSTLMEYPEGYLLQGMGRLAGEARDVLRGEGIKRTFTKLKMTKSEAQRTLPRSAVTRESLGLTEDAPRVVETIAETKPTAPKRGHLRKVS